MSISRNRQGQGGTDSRPSTVQGSQEVPVTDGHSKYGLSDSNSLQLRAPLLGKNRFGRTYDAFENFTKRYPSASGSRSISPEGGCFKKWQECQNAINILLESLKVVSGYLQKVGISEVHRKEAITGLGIELMQQMDNGFSAAVDCKSVDEI